MKLFDLFKAIMDGESFEVEYTIAPHWRPTDVHYALDVASRAVKDALNFEVTDRNIDIEFIRIRKDTININGIDVPAPMTTEPKVNQLVYIPDYTEDCGYMTCYWGGNNLQLKSLQRGVVYANPEDAFERAKIMYGI